MVPSSAVKEPAAIFLTPRDHYRHLRSFCFAPIRQEVSHSLARHPFARTFQPTAALVRLLFPNHPEWHEPIFQLPSGAVLAETGFYPKQDHLPLLPEICQLALLWVLAGQTHEARRLIQWLLPFLEHPTLWVSEKNYDPQEFELSASLLYGYLGKPEKAFESWLKGLSWGAADPFFLGLKKAISGLLLDENLEGPDVFFDQTLSVWADKSAAFTLSGQGTSLGTIREKGVSISAFGPQFYPLTQTEHFGIQGMQGAQSVNESHLSGWTRCFAEPSSWLHTHFESKERTVKIQWLGLTSEKKGAFVFYIKAASAHLGAEVFRPKSLQRYKGSGKQVLFNEGSFIIECSTARTLELIPLAGESCFWGADFLLAFSMSPFDSSEIFSFR